MAPEGPRSIGRYALHGEIGSGGMATVYLGRLLGIGGFSRTVAIKRLRPAFAKDPTFVAMLLDEARLASRVRHPNVVSTLDVGFEGGELFIVLDYVHGEPLSRLIPAARPEGVPADVAVAILASALRGLHAAHEARKKDGSPLGLVHRDVSPQNVLVGQDGIARVLDFGVAKAAGRIQQTRGGELKGKVAYMAPEQLHGQAIDRRADVYSAAVVLWETLVGDRLFDDVPSSGPRTFALPSSLVADVPLDLDGIVACGLAEDREARFSTAEAMAVALENAVKPASPERIAAWVERVAGERLRDRAALVAEVEGAESVGTIPLGPAYPIEPEARSRPTQDLPLVAGAAPTMPMNVTPKPTSTPSERTLLSATVDGDSRPRPIDVKVEEAPTYEPAADDEVKPSGMRLALVAIVAAVVGAAVVVGVFVSSRTSNVSPSTPLASASSVKPANEAAPSPTATPDPTSEAPDQSSANEPPRAEQNPTPIHKSRPAAALPPAPKSTCDPPYRVDADGSHHPKPECF